MKYFIAVFAKTKKTALLKLSLSCSQLCFRASINFQVVTVAMKVPLSKRLSDVTEAERSSVHGV